MLCCRKKKDFLLKSLVGWFVGWLDGMQCSFHSSCQFPKPLLLGDDRKGDIISPMNDDGWMNGCIVIMMRWRRDEARRSEACITLIFCGES